MPSASEVQTSFLGGEWAKTAQGRFDDPAYLTGLGICLNWIPIESGALTRRPGTAFAQATRGGVAGRVIGFNFQQAAAYTVEFTDSHLRFRSGATLVTTNDSVGILAISGANPAVVQTASAVTWASSDQAYFTLLGSTSPLLQNRVFVLTKIDTTHFSLTDGITGATIDGSTLGFVVTPGALINRVLDLSSPYTAGSWATVRLVQAETTAYLLDGTGVKQQQILTATPPAGSAFASFTIATGALRDGPYLDVPPFAPGSTLTIQGDGSFSLTSGIWPDSRRTGLTANDIGRLVRFFNEPPAWPGAGLVTAGVFYTFNLSVDPAQATYWLCNTTAAATSPGTNTTDWTPLAPSRAVGWIEAIIATIVTPTRFTVSFVTSMIYGTSGVIIRTWRLGVYSNEVGWPTVGTYHEGRLWLGGAIPNRWDASMSNKTGIFSPTDVSGVVAQNNGISYTFLSDSVNPALWAKSDDRGIIVGTQEAEWLISATTQNLPLSPTNIQAHPVTHYGSAPIEPRRAGGTLVFVQRFARTLLEYFADVFSGRLNAPKLTRNSRHLTQTALRELAYQAELTPTIWARRGDGGLVGWTYKRENLLSSQGPTFIGGHRHALGSGRVVESIAGGPSIGGNLDTLTMVTNDPATGIRHVELLTDLWEEGNAPTSAWYLDDAIAPSSYSFDLNAQTVTLNGLWHLNGKTVSVFMGGVDAGDVAVAGGSATVKIDGTANDLLTVAYIQPFLANLPAVVGFTYNSDGQALRPGPQKDSGAANGPAFAKVQRTHQIGVLVQDTAGGVGGRGLGFDSFFDKLRPALFRTPDQKLIPENVLFSGIYWAPIDNPYSFDEGQVCWRISRPYPATIAALGGFQATQDR
jgi:hypothetical protein